MTMRLLNARTFHLETYHDHGFRPRYAILSHTWGDEEVSFQDVEAPSPPTHKLGYKKVVETCRRALRMGLDYVWVDTCCIDKTNPTELSIAINSMYQWYQDAEVCFAYLSDVPFLPDDQESQASRFVESRWFQRGWTLQELLGPMHVVFFSGTWDEIGNRATLSPSISIATRIEDKFLGYNGRAYLAEASIAEKMDWAATRKTIRIEDQAYCLLGIFGINMPLLYGEGRNAFIRLQEELIRHSDDQSIFAWGCNDDAELEPKAQGVLAESPAAFLGCSWIEYRGRNSYREPFSLINTGISIKAPCSVDVAGPGASHWHMMLRCGPKDDPTKVLTLPIYRTQDRGEFYSRWKPPSTTRYSTCMRWQPRLITLSVQQDPSSSQGGGLLSTTIWLRNIPPGFSFIELSPPAKWSQARVVQVPAPGPSSFTPSCWIRHRESRAEFTLMLVHRTRFERLARALRIQPTKRIKPILLPSIVCSIRGEVGNSHCTWPASKTLIYVKTSNEFTMDGPVLALSLEETAVEWRHWISIQETLHQTVENLVDILNTLASALAEWQFDLGELGLIAALLSLAAVIEKSGHRPQQDLGWDAQLMDGRGSIQSLQRALVSVIFFCVAGTMLFLPPRHHGGRWPWPLTVFVVVEAIFLLRNNVWAIRALPLLALCWRLWRL